jgi:tetratricopeptide (TPR) repeat protein
MRTGLASALCIGLLALTACQQTPKDLAPMTTDGRVAPLLENLGDLQVEITTSDPMAQRFFNQGMTLLYGFNHAEAVRSFDEVARIDPDCAMAYWGRALAIGPNINASLPEDEDEQDAYEAIQEALRRKASASPKERALIDALATRFSENRGEDREELNAAYMDAMSKVSTEYPGDPEVRVLHAASILNTTPWDYWDESGQPRPGIAAAVAGLESVIASHPKHPGARHYYIHTVEASPDPDRAVESADVLGGLAPAAGHLVHMPSHIYIRVGRYADASNANIKAIAADEDYITQCRSQGIYPANYYPHNIHFLMAALAMEGRSQETLEAARKVASKPDQQSLCQPGNGFPHLLKTQPLFALVRFGRWEEVLEESDFSGDKVFEFAIGHYARGLAYLATDDMPSAEGELASLRELLPSDLLEGLMISEENSLWHLATIGEQVLAGEIAAQKGAYDAAVEHLRKAVTIEDNLTYSEPPDWPIPVRQNLGSVLLAAGRAKEAEAVFREDLTRHRNNGWGLAGLIESLQAQGKAEEAAEAKQQFAKLWAKADVELSGARF